MKKTIFIIGLAIISISCQKVNTSNFEDKLEWIKGTWIINTPPIYAEEKWTWNEDRYIANGFMTNNEDTVFVEKLTIKAVKDDLFLSAKVKDQNNNKEVFFKLISNSPDSLLFENKRHNYPNYIEYVLQPDSSIIARAYGIKKGTKKGDLLHYIKKK